MTERRQVSALLDGSGVIAVSAARDRAAPPLPYSVMVRIVEWVTQNSLDEESTDD